MDIINKFLSKILFKPKKFNIVCHNEKEWDDMQFFLFNKGYYWERNGKTLMNEFKWDYPRILKNYRTGDIFGSKILILDSYEYAMKLNLYKNASLINATSYIRKMKLKKLK